MKTSTRTRIWLLILATFMSCRAASAADVSVDAAVQYQVIDGFGGSESWLLPPASLYDDLFDDLGTSILRFQMFAYTESTPDLPGDEARDNDNDDPFVIDWDGVATGILDAFGPLLQAAQSRGVEIIGTTWSPPAWMKDNSEVETCGSFLPGYEEELVEYILIWVKGMQLYHGVHIDSVSIQNEPDTSAPWADCRYTASQVRDIIKLLGARFEAEGITTRIHAPETTTLSHFANFADTLCQDAVAAGYVDTLTTHPYDANFSNPDQNIPLWTAVHGTASGWGKVLWQTEYGAGAGDTNWSQALLAAQHVHISLVHGHASAWLTYELYKTGGGGGGVIGDSGPYSRFFALKQYFRYVRPEAVRVHASSSDADVLVTAFEHPAQKTLTLVAINRDTTAKSINATLGNLAGAVTTLSTYRSSSTEDSVDIGAIQVSGGAFQATLPAQSVTTFTGAMGTTQNQSPTASATANPTAAGISETVSFDGTGSYDTDGSVVLCEWDFDHDGTTFDTQATGATTTHAYLTAGTYTIALRVTDDDGAVGLDFVDITVSCAPDCAGRQCGDDGCGGSCGTCPASHLCDAQGQCVCPQGLQECAGQCVDTMSNPDHCGACDNACLHGEVCSQGSCQTQCANDLTLCGQSCVDLTTDPLNCGACGNACVMDEECLEGLCTSVCVPDCAGKECGDDGCGGSCGTCPAGDDCVDGVCSTSCPDVDGDGHANRVCGGDDCNDSDPGVHPGADDFCDDGIDQDCDGADEDCGAINGGCGCSVHAQSAPAPWLLLGLFLLWRRRRPVRLPAR